MSNNQICLASIAVMLASLRTPLKFIFVSVAYYQDVI